MKLNCKPGDLAIKVRSDEGDIIPIGAILRCIEHTNGRHWKTKEPQSSWVVEYSGKKPVDHARWSCRDEFLKPLRGDDADDETLTWAAKPEKVTA